MGRYEHSIGSNVVLGLCQAFEEKSAIAVSVLNHMIRVGQPVPFAHPYGQG
jgi:hypothetical protein